MLLTSTSISPGFKTGKSKGHLSPMSLVGGDGHFSYGRDRLRKIQHDTLQWGWHEPLLGKKEVTFAKWCVKYPLGTVDEVLLGEHWMACYYSIFSVGILHWSNWVQACSAYIVSKLSANCNWNWYIVSSTN